MGFAQLGLVSIYKKQDPNEQSLWNTDSARLTFIIKNERGWAFDKKGVNVKDSIIHSKLKSIQTLLLNFMSFIPDPNDHNFVDILNDKRTNADLIQIIENKSFNSKILSCFAPHFYLDKK